MSDFQKHRRRALRPSSPWIVTAVTAAVAFLIWDSTLHGDAAAPASDAKPDRPAYDVRGVTFECAADDVIQVMSDLDARLHIGAIDDVKIDKRRHGRVLVTLSTNTTSGPPSPPRRAASPPKPLPPPAPATEDRRELRVDDAPHPALADLPTEREILSSMSKDEIRQALVDVSRAARLHKDDPAVSERLRTIRQLLMKQLREKSDA